MAEGPQDEDPTGRAGKTGGGAEILRFPQSRVSGANKTRDIKRLGRTALTEKLGVASSHGHWCSVCKGIWFGRAGEVECPVCSNRHG